jgi:hypothetical protein
MQQPARWPLVQYLAIRRALALHPAKVNKNDSLQIQHRSIGDERVEASTTSPARLQMECDATARCKLVRENVFVPSPLPFVASSSFVHTRGLKTLRKILHLPSMKHGIVRRRQVMQW